ncbi:unnamed protein product, partial [Clavelina lepadiformis]
EALWRWSPTKLIAIVNTGLGDITSVKYDTSSFSTDTNNKSQNKMSLGGDYDAACRPGL